MNQINQQGEFSIVTVQPKSYITVSQASKTIRYIDQDEKEAWKGICAIKLGKPGRQILQKSALQVKYYQDLSDKTAELYLQLDLEDRRPFIVQFNPIKDYQHYREYNNIKGNIIYKDLSFRLYKAEAKLVKSILEAQNFIQIDAHDWNLLWTSQTPKAYIFDGLNEYQKVNHFPNTNEITRKDKLCYNILAMQEKFGKDDFDIIPETYVLPDEFADFYIAFHQEKCMWIVKPSSSSQGRGIYLVDNIGEVPIEESCVISKYIDNPLLINETKFDMRIYVLITCFEPLRIYVYDEGLARFACEPFSSQNKNNRYVHLTNYSVNKKHSNFIQNQDYRIDDTGNKWSLSALTKHLEGIGVDTDYMWSRIYDLIVKTILSCESLVVDQVRRLGIHRNNCFDLLGFDVIIDQNLKPWLLEVNLSPSLATDSPLDFHIKGNLIADCLNCVSLRNFDRKKESAMRLRSRIRAKQPLRKSAIVSRSASPSPPRRMESFIGSLKFKEILRDVLEENDRRGHFIRIYPSQGSDYYDQFYIAPRILNKAVYQVLFSNNAPIQPKASTKEVQSIQRPKAASLTPKKLQKCQSCNRNYQPKQTCPICELKQQDQKIVITGDDVLMEYISRLMHIVKTIREEKLKIQWKRKLKKFIEHYVWHTSDKRRGDRNAIWQKLESRLIEMRERRRRLLVSLHKHKGKHFLDDLQQREDQKQLLIRGFTASQLEEMLRSSCKNVALEVISCLVSQDGKGILTQIIQYLAKTVQDKGDNSLLTLKDGKEISEEDYDEAKDGSQQKTVDKLKFSNN